MVTQVIVLKCKECGNNFDTTATYNEHGQMMPFPQLYCDYCDYEIKFGKKQSSVKEKLISNLEPFIGKEEII